MTRAPPRFNTALRAARKRDAASVFTPRIEAEARRDEFDERLGICGYVAADAHLAEFWIGKFEAPNGLARYFIDCLVPFWEVRSAGRRGAVARRAPCATLRVAPGRDISSLRDRGAVSGSPKALFVALALRDTACWVCATSSEPLQSERGTRRAAL
jgi:hypothetical protein